MSAMANERLQKPVLVLNASYEPINICAARRALILVLKGVASAEETSAHAIHSARNAMRLPSVIRLLEYRRIPRQTRALSRKNILMRDRYTCQYCHRTMPSSELTLDQVFPVRFAGAGTWNHMVQGEFGGGHGAVAILAGVAVSHQDVLARKGARLAGDAAVLQQ